MTRALAALASLAMLAALPAAATTQRDLASGIAITPPPGFTATPSPPPAAPAPGGRAVFDVKAPGDTDTGCRVAVSDAPGNALLSQAELNARSASPQYQEAMIGQLSTIYELVGVNTIAHGNILGFGAIGDLRPRPGLAPRAAEVRTLVVFLDTPIQRVVLTCIGEKQDFEARLDGFEAVLGGLELP